MVQYKLGIIYVGLIHLSMMQTLKISSLKVCVTMSTYDHQLYTSVFYESLDTRYIISLHMKTLTLIHFGHECEVFHDEVVLFTQAAPYLTR